MKPLLILGVLLGVALPAYGQRGETLPEKKAVVAVWPSRVTRVNGVLLNVWPKDAPPFPKVNGLELNINPLGPFVAIMAFVHGFFAESQEPLDRPAGDPAFKVVNGIGIATASLEPARINGLDLSLAGSFATETRGLTLALAMNKHYVIHGVTVAAVGNHDQVCRGVQIALINSCRSLRGVQIGLWNKNERRSLLNWNFR